MQSVGSNDIDQGVPKYADQGVPKYAAAGCQGPIYFNPSIDK